MLALRGAFVEPVRGGHPRVAGLPPLIAVVATASLMIIALTLLWRLLSGPVPAKAAVPVDAATQVAAITVIFTGLHLASHGVRWGWRLILWCVVGAMHTVAALALIIAASTSTTTGALFLLTTGVIGSALLVAATALGVRRPGSTFSVSLLLIALALNVVPALVAGLGHDDPMIQQMTNSGFMIILILPAFALALASAASLSSLAVNIAQWSGLGLRDDARTTPARTAWAVVAFLGLTGSAVAWWLESASAWAVLSNGAVAGGGCALATLALKSPRRHRRQPVFLSDLAEHVAEVSMPIGVILGIVGVIAPGVALGLQFWKAGVGTAPDEELMITADLPSATEIAGSPAVVGTANIAHAVAGLVLLLAMVWAVRRGHPVVASLLGPVALCFLAAGLIGQSLQWEISHTVVSGLLGAVVCAVALARWKCLDERGWARILLAQLVCALWPWHTELLDPLSPFTDSHGLFALIVGLLWFMATEAEYANGSSATATRSARMMLFCAHSATVALFAFIIDDVLGAAYWETFDVSLLTSAIPVTAVGILLHLSHRHIDPDPRLRPGGAAMSAHHTE